MRSLRSPAPGESPRGRGRGASLVQDRAHRPRNEKSVMNTVEHIAQQLQARIRQEEWADTGKLPGQRQLAEELGVSRASLREAVTMLESLGLLRSEAGRGVFIARPGDKGMGSAYGRWRFQGRYALRDVYLVRSQLEELAAGLAAEVVTRAGLARLKATVRR